MQTPNVRTTDDQWINYTGIDLPPDSCGIFHWVIAANDHNGSVTIWNMRCAYKRAASNDIEAVGSLQLEKFSSGAFTSVNLSTTIVAPASFIILIKGVAGIAFDWAAELVSQVNVVGATPG